MGSNILLIMQHQYWSSSHLPSVVISISLSYSMKEVSPGVPINQQIMMMICNNLEPICLTFSWPLPTFTLLSVRYVKISVNVNLLIFNVIHYTANFTLFHFGLSLAWLSPVIVKLRDANQTILPEPLTENEMAWVLSIRPLGAVTGKLLILLSSDV